MMKSFLFLLLLFQISCTPFIKTEEQNELITLTTAQNIERDSLITEIHKYNEKKINQGKSILFSESGEGGNPCYWINYANTDFYFKEFAAYLKRWKCNKLSQYLSIASEACNIEVVDYLLKKGVNPNEDFALHRALTSDRFYSLRYPYDEITYRDLKVNLRRDLYRLIIVKKLLKNGAKPELKDSFGKTAFEYAKELENPEFLKLLLE